MSAQIDSVFQKKLDDLKEMSESLMKGLRGEAEPRWGLFSGDVSGLDWEAIHEEFKREELEKAHKEVYKFDKTESEPTGDAMVLKAQADFLSALERDFTMRHRTRLRGIAHDAGRRYGMQHSKGVLQNIIITFLQDMITLIDSNKTYVD